jgi:hypothetical protein
MRPFNIPTGLDRLQVFDERAPTYGWVASYGDGGLRWRDLVRGTILTHMDDGTTEGTDTVISAGSPNGLTISQDCSTVGTRPSYEIGGLDMPAKYWSVDFAAKFSYVASSSTIYMASTAAASSYIKITATRIHVSNVWSTATIIMPAGWVTNEWHRYTIVCNDTTYYTVYLDGEAVNSTPTATGGSAAFAWNNIESMFGQITYGANTTCFNGQIAYFNLYDRLLNTPPIEPLGWLKRRTKPRTHLTFRPQLLTANTS